MGKATASFSRCVIILVDFVCYIDAVQMGNPELDVMRFPVSLLTAAALVEGIVLALVDEYQQRDESAINSPSTSNADLSPDDVDIEKAYEEVIPICCDIAMILDVSIVIWSSYFCWITNDRFNFVNVGGITSMSAVDDIQLISDLAVRYLKGGVYCAYRCTAGKPNTLSSCHHGDFCAGSTTD